MAPIWSWKRMPRSPSPRPIYQKICDQPLKKNTCNLPPYLDSFEHFTKLLPELRVKIWEFACYQPQTIEIGNGSSSVRLISKSKVPAILHASTESRHEALKVYKVLCGRSTIEGNSDALHSSPAYFNAAVDTVHVEQKIHICNPLRMCECTDVTPVDGTSARCVLPSPVENLAQLVNINISPSNDLTRLDLGGIRYLTFKLYWRNNVQWRSLVNNLYWAQHLEAVKFQVSYAFVHEWLHMFREREYHMHLSSCEPHLLRREQAAVLWGRRLLEGSKDITPGTVAEYIERVLGDDLVVYSQVQKMVHEVGCFIGSEFIDFAWTGWWGDIVKKSSLSQLGFTAKDFDDAIERMQELEIEVVMF